MGTNYYHHFNHCDCCGREDVRHIGKSMTSFQGYRPDPDWPSEFTGPEVTTWQQWRDLIRAGGQVWDEYGRQWDAEEFIAAVEETTREQRRRQYDWMVRNGRSLNHDWLDPDCFSFTDVEFS